MSPRQQSQRKASKTNQLRIIAGAWRGRKLTFPDEQGLRPTGDRIRETLFNWLAPYLHGSRCLDAFAGSGILGFEALSRGAHEVVFLETNANTLDYLHRNREQLSATGARIIREDALSWLNREPDAPFDIIFLDPPFADNLQASSLDRIVLHRHFHGATLVYTEYPDGAEVHIPEGWRIHRDKKSGNVRFMLLAPPTLAN